MRITIVGPVYPYRSGIAHFSVELAKTLEGRGHQIQFISFRRQYPGWLFPGKSDRDPSQVPLQFPADYLLDPFLPWTWRATARQIKEFSTHAVIIPWWTTYWAPSFWGLTKILQTQGVPVFFLVHNVLPHEARPWDAWLTRSVLRNGKGFLLLSPSQRERLIELIPGANTAVSPHPAYTMFTGQRIPMKEARKVLGIPDDLTVALFFGIIRPYKGLADCLNAIADLHRGGMDILLLVAGEFWDKKEIYLDQARKLGIEEIVRFEDRYIPNEEVARYFSAANLFLAPYLSGTQSGAANLAAGFGLPIITTQRIAQGLDPNASNLHIIPPGDSRALALAIEKIIKASADISQVVPTDSGWNILAETLENLVAREIPS